MPNAPGPDFLCIGQQKAGTTWLYDQLQFHPDFWMPPVKELHYLCGHFPHTKMRTDLERAAGVANKIRKWQDRREAEHMKRLDDRDFAFFTAVRPLVGQPFSYENYDLFFVPKGPLLTGDISPSYGPMNEARIAATAQRYPELKVILFVRDPIERTWSNINKGVRAGTINPGALEDRDSLARLVQSPSINAHSRGTETLRRWSAHVARSRLGVYLFDDIAERPTEVLAQVLSLLGAKTTTVPEPGFDRKQNSRKVPMSDLAREMLVQQFSDELMAAAACFGGAATSWPGRCGL